MIQRLCTFETLLQIQTNFNGEYKMRVLAQPHALGRTAHQFTDTLHNRDSHSQISCARALKRD